MKVKWGLSVEMTSELKFLPLGGLGEIGINCLVIECDGQIVLLDCGIQFPDASHPGVEIFLPDLTYVVERFDRLKGVVVTHGHEDHIGAIPYLARHGKIDVYCTQFPRGLITHKLSEHREAKEVTFHNIEPERPFKVGPFEFHPTSVQHSIIEALGFGVRTPAGLFVHSGDFKHDPRPVNGKVIGLEQFEKWGKEGVHLLFADSTNAEKAGHTISEHEITDSFEGMLSQQKSRVFIALFASNVRRVGNLMHLAHRLGKKVVLVGRSMHSYTRLAHQQKSLQIPENTLILAESSHEYPDDQVIFLATGSQAEPQSALLRLAEGSHREIKLKKGDLIMMSSRFIPGNEKAISNMINELYRLGAEVMYESIHQIHVSGHGFADELQMLHRACKPKFFVPVHGEYRHLAKHANLAVQSGVAPENVFVIEDGQSVVTDGTKLRLGEKVDLKPIPVVQGALMEQRPLVFTQRRALAKAGIVFSVVMRDAKNKQLLGEPVVRSVGLLFKREKELVEAETEAAKFLSNIYIKNMKDPEIAEVFRRELRRFFRDRACYKPTVISQVFDI